MPAETAWPLPVRVFPAAVGVLMLTSAAGKRPEWPGDIALAIGLGVLSTLAVVLGHLVMDRLGSNAYRRRTKLIQHATDPVVWGLNSVILLMLAVTYFNRALYGDGIPNLNARHVPGMGLLNIFDAMSAVFVVAIVLILFLFPWWPARSKLADEYRFMTLGMPAVAAAFVVIALASTLWLSGLPAVDAMFDAPTIWLEHWRMLFTSIFSRQTQPVAHWQAALAGLAGGLSGRRRKSATNHSGAHGTSLPWASGRARHPAARVRPTFKAGACQGTHTAGRVSL